MTEPTDRYQSLRGHGERALWGSVVLQALEDIAELPLASADYAAAVAFFTSGGPWKQARTNVADALTVHADDLERGGRRFIAARRMVEGLPAEAFVVRTPPVARPAPMPARTCKRRPAGTRLPCGPYGHN